MTGRVPVEDHSFELHGNQAQIGQGCPHTCRVMTRRHQILLFQCHLRTLYVLKKDDALVSCEWPKSQRSVCRRKGLKCLDGCPVEFQEGWLLFTREKSGGKTK